MMEISELVELRPKHLRLMARLIKKLAKRWDRLLEADKPPTFTEQVDDVRWLLMQVEAAALGKSGAPPLFDGRVDVLRDELRKWSESGC